MSRTTFQIHEARAELPLSLLLGVGFALAMFMVMSLAQMIGDARPPERSIDESLIAFNPPDLEIVEEPPKAPEEEPPELEEEPPELSLDQLDIALNPGTGGSLAGDFAMLNIGGQQASKVEEFLDFSSLDQTPRPVGVSGFNFPGRLLKKKVSGKIVLLLKLDEKGRVMDVQVDSSNLPDFNDFVLGEVKGWKFTPPTQQGKPVKAQARLPIPITIR